MYLSGTSMSASPIPIFGSPCSWARLFVRDQGTRAGFRPLKAGWLLSALVGLIVQITLPITRPEVVILFSLLSKALRFH